MAAASTAAAPVQAAPDEAWWRHVFAVIDARDAAAFVALLTADGQFRFGNAPTLIGSDAIRASVSGFFGAIGSCSHRLIRTWSGPCWVACEGEVTYVRHDGSTITVPFANVFELRGTLIAVYRIYIDNSPLFS
jgi:ketosteroid isomerase-like protein